jgi:hypothetical protein
LAGSLVVYAGDNVAAAVAGASVTMTNESADPEYSADELIDLDPENPAKATTTATTIEFTLGAAYALEVAAIINHNLAGATVTLQNDAGLSQAFTIPARTAGGICVNPWLDLRGLANRTDDVWRVVITGAAANVQIGEIVLGTTLRALPWQYGGLRFGRSRPTTPALRTHGGKRLKSDRGFQVRRYVGTVGRESSRTMLETLWESAKGTVLPFLLIPRDDVNDAALVEFSSEEFGEELDGPTATAILLELEEASSGLPL